MRIKHIKTNKEGEPMANPGMECPEKPQTGADRFDWAVFYAEEKKYHSGLLPFEDKEEVKAELFFQKADGLQIDAASNIIFKPDTLIPVDIEVEVVTKEQEEWSDETGAFMIEYKVLRIKP